MNRDDLDQIMEVEFSAFSSPWLREMFIAEIEGPLSTSVVGMDGEHLAGYATYRVIIDEAHLMNIAVHPHYRNMGMGRKFMLHVLADCKEQGADYIYLEVRESNRPARGLYGDLGFEVIGVRRGYYTDDREDAIVMAKRLR
jgi:[ribosomal protein S18]-alanine N-acetyltransferase